MAIIQSSPTLAALGKRINIPLTPTSPPGLVEADTVDPWIQAGKYGLGWTYFALAVVGSVVFVRIWHWWQDKIRQAIYKQEVEEHYRNLYSLDPDFAVSAMQTSQTTRHFFPETAAEKRDFKPKTDFSSIGWVLDTLALFRWVFYRPIPDLTWGRKWRFTFSSLAVLAVGLIALIFVTLWVFLQQPLYWQSIQYGSPPVAIRAGMIACAMTPWIVATSMKANLLTIITGIGPERLNVFHRWAGYLCLFLALIHMAPFYVQPVWDDGGMIVFSRLFPEGSGVIYGTGISCLVPLIWLCVASLPIIRRIAYEVFVMLHVPVGAIYLGLLFWHTKNYLNSWGYLWSSVAIWGLSYFLRVFNLNWSRPWRLSWLVGDEASITLMTEDAIKITVPTQMKWKPGQYVYLRMPGISFFENHPFTISSLYSEDFPSDYGENYRDCVLVFKPYGGFTRKVLDIASEKGPFHTYRAYLDGPYGGMRRELAAFDTCILIAGGSGVTALMSQLLNLIKRMRDGKAITKKIVVVWAMKRLEAMDWFREELRICREAAPPESVTCKFFVTAMKRPSQPMMPRERAPRPLSNLFHDKLDGFVAGIASKRNSAWIKEEAQGNSEYEQQLRMEDEDRITALPQPKHLQPHQMPPTGSQPTTTTTTTTNRESLHEDALRQLEGRTESVHETKAEEAGPRPKTSENLDVKSQNNDIEFHFPPIRHREGLQPHFNYAPNSNRNSLIGTVTPPTAGAESLSHSNKSADQPRSAGPSTDINTTTSPINPPELAHLRTTNLPPRTDSTRPTSTFGPPSGFEFGFPETPTELQKSLMRFAFPVPHQIDGGWSIEYGRPDLGYMLREWATGPPDGRGILGRRTAVFVCGPAAMRVGVATTVAKLQAEIWGDDMLEEIFLHTENYAL